MSFSPIQKHLLLSLSTEGQCKTHFHGTALRYYCTESIQWHRYENILMQCTCFPFSNSPIFLLDSKSLHSMFQSCSCDVPSALCTSCCRNVCMTFPLETLPPRRPNWGSSLPPDNFVSRGSISHIWYVCFSKEKIIWHKIRKITARLEKGLKTCCHKQQQVIRRCRNFRWINPIKIAF